MRRPVFVVVTALALAGAVVGCGESDDAAPAAASDTAVQPAAAPPPASASGRPVSAPLLRGRATRLNGRRDDLARYRGDVVLVVNTASQCGYTPQFAGLERLYRERRADGLVLLGFPANDFAGQEPRSDEEIASFCRENFGVSFPMFAKTTVTGARAHPLYRRLAAAAGAPEWNFNKYLIDRRGRVVARFGAGTEPDAPELTKRIDALL